MIKIVIGVMLVFLFLLLISMLPRLWFTTAAYESETNINAACTQLGTPTANACGGRVVREFSLGTIEFSINCSVTGRVKKDGSVNFSSCYPILK